MINFLHCLLSRSAPGRLAESYCATEDNVKVCGAKPASALILSFFLISLLLTLSIGVSFIVMQDVRTVRTVVAGTQARYAAEGMSELALLALEENLPGYAPSYSDYEFTTEALASLTIDARGEAVPCDGGWRQLDHNESVQLALFAQNDASGNTEKLNDFYVEFYVGDEAGNPTGASGDVLRWKILGLRNGQTEAISEFIPLFNNRITPEVPSVFGSHVTDAALPSGYWTAKYYEARGGSYVYHAAYPISEFLSGHDLNYLILTNVAQSGASNQMFFRLHINNGESVCEYVTIESTADVEFGGARQSLETTIREGESLPVFDFVLYHTDG